MLSEKAFLEDEVQMVDAGLNLLSLKSKLLKCFKLKQSALFSMLFILQSEPQKKKNIIKLNCTLLHKDNIFQSLSTRFPSGTAYIHGRVGGVSAGSTQQGGEIAPTSTRPQLK
jgi:hypothetical protein